MVGLSRILSVILAAIALFWVLRVGSVGFDPSPPGMRAVTERLINGQQFDTDVLAKFDAATSKALHRDLCVADELKAVSMIRLARAQQAYSDWFNAQNHDDGPGQGSAVSIPPKGGAAGFLAGQKPAGAAGSPAGQSPAGAAAIVASGASRATSPAADAASRPADEAPSPIPTPQDAAKRTSSPESAELAARLDDLAHAAVTNLYCSPYQSLAWTILALGEFLANGHTPRLDRLIDFSYRTGPFEGWPLARRLDLLVSIAPDLTPGQQAMLKDQIAAVIESDLHVLLAMLYLQQDDAHQAILRSLFTDMSARDQNVLADFIRRAGSDIDLPYVSRRGARPWDG